MTNQVKGLTRDQIVARVDDWLDRLNELYRRIEACAARVGSQVLRKSIPQTREDLMIRFDVEPIDLPALAVVSEKSRVSFVPLALWVVGANGRVNITTNTRTYILIDEEEYGNPPRWVIVNRAKRNDQIELDDETILRLIRDEALFQ